MLVATGVTGGLNYVSNVVVGRMLGPADYSIFASLVSLLVVLTVVAGVVQTVITNYVARLRSQGELAGIGAFLVQLLKRLLLWGIAGVLVVSLLAKPFATVLQIPSPLPIVVFGLVLLPTAALPVAYGGLRGLQRFGALGATQITTALFRLVAVVGLLSLGLGATGAVASLPLSTFGALAVGVFFLGDVLRQWDRGVVPKLDGLLDFSFHVALAIISFAVLSNIDVLVVKSRFSPAEAGLYSAVATLGRTTLWLSSAVLMLFLPKAVEQHARKRSVAGLMRRGLLAVGFLCGGVTALFFLFPSLIVSRLFGDQYLANASLLGWYALAMTVFSLVSVWLFYYVAVQEKRYAFILALGAGLLLVALALLGSTLTKVVAIMVGVGVVLYLAGEILHLTKQSKTR
jgi:O-antigen/teichoic acid export membrane protein